MTHQNLTLADYGWTAHFQSQLDLEDIETALPVRVLTVHRNAVEVAGPDYEGRIPPFAVDSDAKDHDGERETATAGDWLLLERESLRPRRILDRRSLFKRKAAGKTIRAQLMAANVDTLFIVSSCNLDFNAARLERYLALAHEAEVTPVVVLTKADLSPDTDSHLSAARRLGSSLIVEAVDARSAEDAERLSPWCGRGQTIALLGSSGVGKSTLLNSLAAAPLQDTGAIRSGDDRGKHTTTGRSLHRLPSGAWLMDTPGMRELQLTDVENGINTVFGDLAALAATCKFNDCDHEAEPGCAVQAAIQSGALDNERLKRYRKLLREDARNSETLADAHAKARAFGKMARKSMQAKRDRNGF